MLDKISQTVKFVQENSKYVKINYLVVDKFLDSFKEPKFWLMSNPFNILDLDIEELVNFLLIYHTIGDYCFWGEPKWKIETDEGILDGSFAIMYIVLKWFKEHKSFDVLKFEFKDILKGNVEIPLIEERYEELVMMNEFLKGKSFYKMVQDLTKDEDLFNFLITNLPYFKDEREYKGREVYFYKRAQLLTSDILHVRSIIERIEVDYTNLVGCADYKIPQVMHSLGMLEYDKSLEERLENLVEIPFNSEEEVEIRANSLMVVDYIYKRLNKKIARMDINDLLWILGQDKAKINKKYHRTKTVNY